MTTAVLATPPYLAFYDNDGNPLSNGLIYTYAAGTAFSVPKATYTDSTGNTQMSNPIQLDSAGRSVWWLIGSYGYVVKDSLGNTIRTTDNVTAFTTLAAANNAYFQTFSGDGTTTVFTTSDDLGTDENGLDIEIYTGLQVLVKNGTFTTDTDWTKGAGWTIAAGVATATGAISTAISQPSVFTIVAGQAYSVTYTITRSAGGLIPSVGGVNGVERVAAGTYNEVIVAGSTQTLAFTGNAFTGTLDNVSINLVTAGGWAPINPNAYTINGTSLTFASAPPTGTNNIQVRAPSLLLGAASAAAAAAEASATAALASEVAAAGSAVSAAAFAQAKNKWTFSSTTTMAAPSTGNIRFNNATLASVTAIAISDLSANAGNPDVSPWVLSWDDVTGATVRGTLYIFKDETNFVFYNITGATTDNALWSQLAVTYLTGNGTISNTDSLYIGFAAAGSVTVTGGITALTGDVTASGSGSVSTTLSATLQNRINLDFFSWNIPVVSDGTYKVAINVPFGFTLNSVTTICTSGTCTATTKINTTALGGTANSVSSSQQVQTHSSANTVVATDAINLTISSNSSCLGLCITWKITRT